VNSKHLYFSSGVIAVLALSAIARSIVPQSSTHKPTLKVMGAANVPAHVLAALDRACLDCHSNDTRWPWYARLPFAGEMIGEDVSKLAGPDKQKESAAIIDRIKSGKNLDHFETTGMTKNGRQIDVSLAMSALRDERGRVIGASSIARDISERVEDRRVELGRGREVADLQVQMVDQPAAVELHRFVLELGSRLEAARRAGGSFTAARTGARCRRA